LPQGVTAQIPTIVISHGVASDRTTFAYLGRHLASHGFAVAVVEHPDTSSKKFERFLGGLDKPPQPDTFINRPLDIKYLLDELERRAQSSPDWNLNLREVGAIGQSFGGYTVLALAGAELNFTQLQQECGDRERKISFNLSMLLQCRAKDLLANNRLQDNRIKAVLAVNPLSSSIFGQQGLSQIQVPTMLVAGSGDVFAPPLPEQFHPFTWLTTPEKYLLVLEKGTHFSFLGAEGKGVLPVPPGLIGPNPAIARPVLSAVSTAFFQNYLQKRTEFANYLSQSYVEFLSPTPYNLSLVRNLTESQLEAAISK